MLIAVGLGAGIPYLVDWIGKRWKKDVPSPELTRRTWFSLAVFGLMFYWFIQGAFFGFSLANTTLKPPVPQETLTWVRNNTPKNGQFLILTGNDAGLMSEPIQEWFPALAERRSQVTLQGLEWTLGDQFFPRLEALRALQQCETSACVEQWSIETKLEYAYVLISKTELAGKLLVSFSQDKKYTLIYENSQYAIFKK